MSSLEERKEQLKEALFKHFGEGDYLFLSSPGRVELIGNHTDHQNGHVAACAIDIDNLLCFRKTDSRKVQIVDSQFGEIQVDLNDLAFVEAEKNTSRALIKGIAKAIEDKGFELNGFYGVCDSRVLIGSGISSSACFEVMIAECFNLLYCQGKLSPLEKAKISQYAENSYFGKPCGLMDQLAIAYGGVLAIDFKTEDIKRFDFSFANHGYRMVLVNTKASHDDLTEDYALVTKEMKAVAHEFNVEKLSDIDAKDFYERLPQIREHLRNDRAILRAIHYFEEDKRAKEFALAMEKDDINLALKLMRESGNSSYKYLQNVYTTSNTRMQAVSLALALSEKELNGEGAVRVHGGGFAGTVLAIVPEQKLLGYIKALAKIFGDDAVMIVNVK